MMLPFHARFACAAALLAALLLSACAADPASRGAWPYPVPPSMPGSGSGSVPPDGAPPEALPPELPKPPVIIKPLPPVAGPDAPPPLLNSYPRTLEASGLAAPVLALVKQSREAKRGKNYDQAEAALERALRIEPRNPWVWQQLGGLHLLMGQQEQALSEARKSNSLGKRNPWIEVENYRVIAQTSGALGNHAEALQAQARYEDRQRWITTPPLATPPPAQ